MKKLFLAILIIGCFSVQGQTYSPTGTGWKLIPKQQTDSMQILKFLKINGEKIKFTSATDGQILQRDAGTWKNKTVAAFSYDSLKFYPSTGLLKLWKGGSVALSTTLDGRYALTTAMTDSLHNVRLSIPTGVMKIADYDPSHTGGQIVNTTSVQTLVNKTITSPSITDFTLSQHNHSGTTQGGLLNSDVITQGSTHLFSPFNYASGNYSLSSGNLGIGGTPTGYKLDVFGNQRVQQLTITDNLTFGGVTITGIQTGIGTNSLLVTKNYVDDQIVTAGGYTDEKAQDAVGGILDDGTIDDVIFTYNDAGNKISASVKNDSHNHTGSTISGLSVSNFTSQNISNWTNNSGYVPSSYGLSGDLSGTIASPYIASNAVTLGKFQTIATNSFLGRTTSGTGNVEVLSVSSAQGLLGLGSAAYTSSSAYATSGHTHSDLQPLDADLTSIGGLTGTIGYLKKTATNTWTLDNSTFLTGITGSMVTTALTFTPYNSTNPAGYVTSSGVSSAISSALTGYATTASLGTYLTGITGSMVTSALGYTPYNGSTNPSGFITSSALSGYWYSGNHPTTLSGYGITDTPWTGLGYITSSSLSGYTTTSGLTTLLSGYVPYTGASTDVFLGTPSITATNFTLSDRRLKENIQPLNFQGFTPIFHQFTMKADPSHKIHYGVIAQEVENYAPELVKEDAKGTKSVNYTELLILEVVRLEDIVQSLQKRINALENEK